MLQKTDAQTENAGAAMEGATADAVDKQTSALDEEWDAFVAGHPLGHQEQTSGYARIRQRFGFNRERVVVRHAGAIVGGAQILVRPTPIGSMALINRAPLAWGDDAQILEQVVCEIDALAEAKRIASVAVVTFTPQELVRRVLQSRGFQPCETWIKRTYTSQIAIDQTDEQILKSMASKGRYNARLALRKGVAVRVGTRSDIGKFYELHRETAEFQKFPIYEQAYFEYLWDCFEGSDRLALFLAEYEGRPIGAILNTVVGDHMLYGWGGMHRGEAESRLMANYLLHYMAMCWARDHGCTRYDTVGISATNEAGLTRFKTRIAPERVHWPAPMRKWYGMLAPWRNRLSSIAGTRPAVTRSVKRVAGRLGLRPKVPH